MRMLSVIGALALVLAPAGPSGFAADTSPARKEVAQERAAPDPAANKAGGTIDPPAALPLVTVNQGGNIRMAQSGYILGTSVGQDVSGSLSADGLELGVGFWYGVASLTGSACPIALTGDVNLSGDVNSTDIIYVVNYVLKAGPEPLICEASGDANCTGEVNSTDIIVMVNYVLKGGPAPCDVCTLIPGMWTCP